MFRPHTLPALCPLIICLARCALVNLARSALANLARCALANLARCAPVNLARSALALSLALTVLPAAHAMPTGTPLMISDAQARGVSPAVLRAALADADVIVLGEIHDNPNHHRARATLLHALAARQPVVVVEQLDAGRSVNPALSLEPALDVARFDRTGWHWPLHQPVFDAARAERMPLIGGNLPTTEVARIAREGRPAVPTALLSRLDAAPLSDSARQALDQILVDGHCGHALGANAERLRLAQRARDAELAATVLAQNKPVILIAGNGHARKDFGVPQLLHAADPSLKVLSIGLEEARRADLGEPLAQPFPYDYVITTTAVERDDPCAAFARAPARP